MGIDTGIALSGVKTKLIIQAYKDAAFSQEDTDKKFSTMMTPKSYVLSTKIESNKQQPSGNSSNDSSYDKTSPVTLDLEFMFDRSGVLEGFPRTDDDGKIGIAGDIDKFKLVVSQYDGDKHQPNYLKILWGSLKFNCKLTELNIEYKLFLADGTPIRAVAKAKFTEFTEADRRAAEEKKSSPDLTHMRVVKEGDTLPLMTYRIYGDSKYYLEVAKANGLANFRKLTPGQQIWFPPVEKKS